MCRAAWSTAGTDGEASVCLSFTGKLGNNHRFGTLEYERCYKSSIVQLNLLVNPSTEKEVEVLYQALYVFISDWD